MHVQNGCFANQIYCFFEVLVAVAVVHGILRPLIGILRRQRQQEGLTHNRFYKQNNNSSRREITEF